MASNKEFSLLTKLTLNLAGFDTGVEQAKKKTSDLAKGTEQASNSIKSSFSGLSGLTDGLLTPLSGLKGVISGGVGAFKTMIPSITGVKSALISSGIGAIVVALGLAFSALTSYLGGSSEGAKQLKAAFSYVSGAITAILNRVKLLGRALVDVFRGDFKKAAEDLEAAFKSGFTDEIINSAKTANALEKEKQALTKRRYEFEMKEAEIQKEINILNAKAQNKDDLSIESLTEKKKYLHEADQKALKLNQEKVALLKAEFDYADKIVKTKGLSATSEDKENKKEKWVALQQAESEYYISTAANSKAELKLNKQIRAEEKADNEKAAKEKEALEKLTNENTELDLANNKEAAKTKKELMEAEIAEWRQKELEKVNAVKITTPEIVKLQEDLRKKIDDLAKSKKDKAQSEIDTTEQERNLQFQKSFNSQETAILKEKYDGFLISKKEYDDKIRALDIQAHKDELIQLEQQHNKGEISEENYKNALKQINDKYNTQQAIANKTVWQQLQGNIASSQAKTQLFSTAINGLSDSIVSLVSTGKTSFKSMVTSMLQGFRQIINGLLAQSIAGVIAGESKKGLLGLALAGVGIGIVEGMFASLPSFATGGIVPGVSYTGDQVLARVNSGEMILNAGQQASLFKMLNSGTDNFGTISGGAVKFEIEGSKLVGVLNNHSKRVKNFG